MQQDENEPGWPRTASDPGAAMSNQQSNQQLYWRRTQRVTAVLLALWFVASFGVSYFSRELSFVFFGWPFSFWMAAQGSLLVFGLITAFYAWYMHRLDLRHGFEEEV